MVGTCEKFFQKVKQLLYSKSFAMVKWATRQSIDGGIVDGVVAIGEISC
jgi:hypothetical protein